MGRALLSSSGRGSNGVQSLGVGQSSDSEQGIEIQ
ncbi:uncharacterized protein G2W53_031470 [Senna tora]|uniref:Uncharacterized protein n=1 Tax=Senna tora TaxID=362788 RepID=A0A834TAP2_9FABA|nr:uncharacterized protein G2W53_031470 [Senna tora]